MNTTRISLIFALLVFFTHAHQDGLEEEGVPSFSLPQIYYVCPGSTSVRAQAACNLLAKGTLPIGGTSVSLRFSYNQVAVSGLFPQTISFGFSLNIITAGGYWGTPTSVTLTLNPTSTISLTLSDVLSALFKSTSVQFGDAFTDSTFNKVLGSVSVKITKLVVGVDYRGVRVDGQLSTGISSQFSMLYVKDKTESLGFLVTFPLAGSETTLQNLLGPVYDVLSIFTLDKITLAFSNNKPDDKGAPLMDGLDKAKFAKGVTFEIAVKFDPDSKNDFQGLLGRIFKGPYTVSFTYADQSNWALALKLPDVPIWGTVTLTQVSLTSKLDKDFLSVSLQCGVSFSLNKQPITILGKISVGFKPPITLSMRLELQGAIVNAFGVPGLTIQDVAGEIGFVNTPNLINNFEVRGTVLWGPDNIGGTFGVKVDVKDPTNNYLLVKLNPINVGQIVYALAGRDIYSKLPVCVSQSGFPDGVFFSFAEKEQNVGFVVPAGQSFSGTLNFLGFTAQVAMNSVPYTSLKSLAVFSPFRLWNDIVVFQRSKDISNLGPQFYFEVSIPAVTVYADIQGYLSTWLFSVDVKFVLGPSSATFSFQTSIYNLASCAVDLTLNYASNTIGFAFQVKVSTGDTINEIGNRLTALRSRAIDSLQSAKNDVADKQKKLSDLASNLCNGGAVCEFKCGFQLLETEEIVSLKAELEADIGAQSDEVLDVEQEDHEEDESLMELSSETASGVGCRWWDVPCWAQQAKEEAERLAREQLAKLAQETIGNLVAVGCSAAQDTCGAGCFAAQADVRAAAATLTAAKQTLDAATQVVKGVVDAIDLLKSNLQLEIGFGGQLSNANFGINFAFALRAGQNDLSFSVNFDVRTVRVADLIEAVWGRIKDFLRQIQPNVQNYF